MTFTEMARDIIKNNRFLSLATRNSSGEVWATPLSYSIDGEYNFYFTTAVDSIHINHIRENPYVAFAIFDSTRCVSAIDGVQIKGIVGEVERERLPEIVKQYYLQVFPDTKERSEWEAPWEHFTEAEFPVYRFFQIMPLEIYKRDTDNDTVDRRVKIELNELKYQN
jgi:uncharacterized protein YhbP (UPF0306 family)